MFVNKCVICVAFCAATFFPFDLSASTFDFSFGGPGLSGSLSITYGTATDKKYPQAYEITGISGAISDSNNGLKLVNASVTTLVPINYAAPEPSNMLAPNDFSHFPVATGLMHGFISFDNLYYPAGSPPTSTDYQVHGGFLDIYGLLFNLSNGDTVNLWSNGDATGTGQGLIDYGMAVVNPNNALDYVAGGVAISPEPSALPLFGLGLVAVGVVLRRRLVPSNWIFNNTK